MRIVIGEDSALFREGLAALLLSAGHSVVGKAGDGPGLVAVVREARPDLALIDVRMPPDHTDDGARAAIAVRSEFPTLGIVLLSQHVETKQSVALVTQGRFGYLLKDRVLDVDEFMSTLQRVASGGSALDPEVVSRLLAVGRGTSMLSQLTPRELEVLSLMAEGRTNHAISNHLYLTERTVETHISNIMSKLDLGSNPDGHRRVLAVLAFLEAHQPGRS